MPLANALRPVPPRLSTCASRVAPDLACLSWQLEQGKERTAHLVEAADRAAGAATSATDATATALEQLSIRVVDESTETWRRRALQLWREQGCVVFPSLLPATTAWNRSG